MITDATFWPRPHDSVLSLDAEAPIMRSLVRLKYERNL